MTRLVSGLVLAVAVTAGVWWLPAIGLRVLAMVVAALAAHEYAGIVGGGRRSGELTLTAVTVVTCWWSAGGTPEHVVLLIAFGLVWVGLDVIAAGTPIGLAAARFFGAWYIGLPLGLLASVHQIGGPTVTLLLLATIVVSDSSQYYTGRTFGRRPLAPAISPKKTIEGAIGGLLCATAFLALVGPRVLEGRSAMSFVPLGLVLVTLGIGGDLFESRLKRAAGVKDSSSLIPGHGGVLDRIDALLFAIPPFYLFLRGLGGL